jgi:hypothetical protein
MSSGAAKSLGEADLDALVVEDQAAESLVGQPTAEQSKRLGFGDASSHPPLD